MESRVRSRFLAVDAESMELVPRRTKDYLPEDSFACFVAEAVERLDLSQVEDRYEDRGRHAYPPRQLLAVWIYGYATGVNTARPLAERCRYDLRFRYLCGDLTPERDTLLRFRRRCGDFLDQWFREVLLEAGRRGMVDLARVCVDGTKVKANASLSRTRRLRDLEEQERTLLRALELADEIEAQDADAATDDAVREGLERTLAKVREGKGVVVRKMLETSESENRAAAKCNLTDPDSRIMKTAKKAWQQSYNGQIGVDPDSHLVVTRHVSDRPNDKREIEPTLEAIEEIPESVGKVEAVVADAGYYSEESLERCEAAATTPYIASGRKLPTPEPEDATKASSGETPARRNAERLADPAGREVYQGRSASVETVFGIFRNVMQFNEFRRRGLAAVNAEWSLVCIAWNLKRMHKLKNLCNPRGRSALF